MPSKFKGQIIVDISSKIVVGQTYKGKIIVDISAPTLPLRVRSPLIVNITPEQTPKQETTLRYPFGVQMIPVNINISEPLIATALEFVSNALDVYVDEDRELKTLLNYGEDKQSVALAYRQGLLPKSIQLKLLQPVPDDVNINTSVFLSREVAKSLIDKVKIRFAPPIDATPYLRPKNTKVDANPNLGKHLKDITLQRLAIDSGSIGWSDDYKNISFEDKIFRQWYSYDFNSSEINMDFTDYNNFIFYGSAALRLSAFKEKLRRIEKLELQRRQFVTSSFTGSTNTAGAIYVQEQSAQVAKQIEDIVRAFDRYEQYLYFTPSGSYSPYTASAYYAEDGYEYHVNAYWPKIGQTIAPTTSSVATEWFDTQYAIAQRFDEFNENNLINTIPTHIREDADSDAYITFVSMIGHFFDTIKPFIDQFPNINDRWLDPDEGLSKDLINEIAESYGFRLPTLNSVYSLSDEIIGTDEEQPRRQFTAQTYKRLLHNLPLFAKAKGTKNAIQTLLRSFGIPPEFLTIREVGAATTSSYKVYDEFSTGLDFDSGSTSYVKLPFSASLREVQALQFNVLLPSQKFNTLLTGDDSWALHTVPHPTITDYGRLMLLSGSSVAALTDFYPIFTNDLINISLQNDGGSVSVQIMSTEGDTMVFTSPKVVSSIPFDTVWKNTQYLYVGGSGSAVLANLEGTIDEFRMWGKTLSQEAIETNAYDPGSNAADDYADPSDYLFAQLSFNFIENSLLTGSAPNYIINESPYGDIAVSPSMEQFEVYNINTGSFTRYSRIVKQIAPIMGSQTYVTNKIRVLPPPVFDISNQTSTGVKKLSRKKSIVLPEQKRLQATRNEVLVSLSPTDFVNQNIIRNFGAENINDIIGLPSRIYQGNNLTLAKLQEHYSQYYYAPVKINEFIRVLSGVSSILDQTLNYFIPSKAVLFKGIIIEPNILERTTVPLIRNVRTYGAGTRKTLNAAASLTGSRPDYTATFNVSQTIDLDEVRNVAGSSLTQNANIDISNNFMSLDANTNSFRTDIDYLQNINVSAVNNKYSGDISHSFSDVLNARYNSYNSTITQSFDIGVASSVSSQNGILKGTPETSPIDLLESTAFTINVDRLKAKLPSTVAQPSATKSDTSGSVKTKKIRTNASVQSVGTQISHSIYEIQTSVGYYTGSTKLFTGVEFNADTVIYNAVNIDTRLDLVNKIKYNDVNYGSEGAEPYKRVYPRKLFKSEIQTSRIGGNKSLYVPALREIKPIADLTEVGTRTYFNNPDGVYLFTKTEKLPVYPKPISFQSATTWSYGQTYNIYDVVYQSISPYDETLNDLAITAQGGNGKYYVFNTRAAYTSSTEGSYYLGGVPSYVPPSLDRNNWKLLKFKPVEVREPKRIVFDTFKIALPELNNFRTTTISIDRIIDIPNRYVDTLSIPSIESASYATGEITLQNTLALFALQSNASNIRVRLYGTKTQRNADISRGVNVTPTGSHGVLLDTVLTNNNVATLTNPVPFIIAGETPPNATVYYTIDNLTSTIKLSTTIYAFYFALEIEPRIPFGYLPKHYRFYRDNSTATKRRNYEGCKNTVDTTIDGLPPVQVFISEGNELTVSPTQTNTEIVTGGGGQLNVT